MSDPKPVAPHDDYSLDEKPAGGVNLTLIYSLIALAMLAAIVFAALIVLPFYHRR